MDRKPKRIKQRSNSPISLSSMNDPSSSNTDAAALSSTHNRGSASPERYSLRRRGGVQEQDNISRIVSSPPPLPAAGAATASVTDDTFQSNSGSRRYLKRKQQHQQQQAEASSSTSVTTGQNGQHGENKLSHHHPNKKRKSKKSSKGKNKASSVGQSNKTNEVTSSSSLTQTITNDNISTNEKTVKGKERATVVVNSNTSIRPTPIDQAQTCPEEPETEHDINDMAVADAKQQQQQQQQQQYNNFPDINATNEEEDDEEEEFQQSSPFTHLSQYPDPFLDSIQGTTTATQRPGFDDNMIRMQFDLFTGGGSAVSGRFRSILAGLADNEAGTSSQMTALQELSEILSISNEDTLIGMFPCDSIVRELTRILSSPETSPEIESNAISQEDISMMDEETMIAFALNSSGGGGGGNSAGNIETMTLACQCLSNLLHALPSSASNIVAHGAIEILCQKLEPSDYIDLPEQALSVLEKLAVQFPRAVVQGGGLNAALKHFHFFTIHLQRSAIKTAASCFRNLDVTSNSFTRIIDIIPTLIETLSYPDNTVVEDTCLCWARLIDSCSTSKEHMERIITTDLLQKMVQLIPVPGRGTSASQSGSNNNTSSDSGNHRVGGNGGAFAHLLRIFRSISKYSPQLSYQLLELDLVACFYKIMTGSSTVPTTTDDMPTNFTLNNKWRDSMIAMMGILVDLLPSLPSELLSPDRFLDSEPISSRTRSARNSNSEGIPPLVRRRTESSSTSFSPYHRYNSHHEHQKHQQTEVHVQLLKNNPAIFQRISLILIPLLTEVYTSMANLPLRELVTHVLVKLVHFTDADTLKLISMRIPLSAFLADILAQQDHATLVVDALYQSELLFNKLPDIYSDAFEIEGVLHEINTIANMSLEDTPTTTEANEDTLHQQNQYMMTMPPFSSFLMNSSRLPGYRSGSHHMINNSEVGIGQGPTRRYVILLAQNFLRIYNSHVWHQQYYHHHHRSPQRGHQQQQQTNISGQYQTRLDKLQSISQKLMNCTDNNYVSALTEFIAFLNSSSIGISGFELSHSGIINALLFYLTGNNNQQQQQFSPSSSSSLALRRNAFENLIIQRHPVVLKTLIDRLLESLNRSETFRITTPMDAFNDGSSNSMGMLNRRIRVRLTGEGQRIPFEHRYLMASVPIAACLKNLEDYLMSRMGTLRSPSSSQEDDDDEDEGVNERSHHRTRSGDSDDDDDDDDVNSDDDSICDPEMVNPFGEEQAMDTDNEEEDMVELDRNVMASGEQTVAGASSTTNTANNIIREPLSTGEQVNQNSKHGHWKIQFYVRNTPVSSQSTIYGVIHQHEQPNNRSAWVPYYRLSYKLVWVSEEEEGNSRITPQGSSPTIEQQQQQEPSELINNPTCLKALQLSSTIFDLFSSSSAASVHKNIVNIHSFVNRKLTGKIQRQLEEPLIVASRCLPQWTYWFMHQYPFLFPFETRYQFLQSTSYGYNRLMARWQSLQMRSNTNQPSHQRQAMNAMDDFVGHHHHHHGSSEPLFHRVSRYKAKIPRTHLLQSTTKILDQYMVDSNATLEVQFTGEEGTGLGPTLEFYAAMSKEFCKKSLNMWRNNEDSNSKEDEDIYVSTKHGLFPMPMVAQKDSLKLFQTLGHFVAKAMVDFRLIDMPFSPAFFKVLFSTKEEPFTLIKEIDPVLGKSLDDLRAYLLQKNLLEADKSLTGHKKSAAIKSIEINGTRLEDLCLDFTLPGHPDIQLKNNGENIPVTIRNLEEYLDLLVDKMVGSGIKEQMNMFRQGFNRVFDVDNLKVLTPNELVALFGNSVEDWSYQTISNAIHADHGFTLESQTVQNLLTTLAQMKEEERRDFLQFTTGSPRLPIGGWQAMRPAFTVVRKQCEPPLRADDYLPSVMTCANYLKLPDYTSKYVLQQRLLKSMREGKNSFLLS